MGLDFICRDEIGEVLKPNYLSHAYGKIIKDCGFRHTRFHDLRAAVGTIILEETNDLQLVRKILRHSNINTTANVYVNRTSLNYQEKGTDSMDPVLDNIKK